MEQQASVVASLLWPKGLRCWNASRWFSRPSHTKEKVLAVLARVVSLVDQGAVALTLYRALQDRKRIAPNLLG